MSGRSAPPFALRALALPRCSKQSVLAPLALRRADALR